MEADLLAQAFTKNLLKEGASFGASATQGSLRPCCNSVCPVSVYSLPLSSPVTSSNLGGAKRCVQRRRRRAEGPCWGLVKAQRDQGPLPTARAVGGGQEKLERPKFSFYHTGFVNTVLENKTFLALKGTANLWICLKPHPGDEQGNLTGDI